MKSYNQPVEPLHIYIYKPTKYIYPQSTTVSVLSSELGHPPLPQAPPPPGTKGGTNSPAGESRGGFQFGQLEKKAQYSVYSVVFMRVKNQVANSAEHYLFFREGLRKEETNKTGQKDESIFGSLGETLRARNIYVSPYRLRETFPLNRQTNK